MEYKVSELAEKAGVTKRTIHFYISKGLLLPPKGSGVNSIYDDSHLERLLLIKKLQEQYMPLNKIREYIMENPTEKVGEKKLKKKEVEEIHEESEIIEDEEAAKVSLCPENGQENRPLVRNWDKKTVPLSAFVRAELLHIIRRMCAGFLRWSIVKRMP